MSSSPLSTGCPGSTSSGSWDRLATYHRPNSNRCTISSNSPASSRRDSTKTVSGKPGAVQRVGATLRFIQPGKPIQNALVESFNGKFRDACLNEHWFINIADARRTIEGWRVHYNTVRTVRWDFLPRSNFGVRPTGAVEKPAPPGPWKTLRVPLFPTASTAGIIHKLPHSGVGPKFGGRSSPA